MLSCEMKKNSMVIKFIEEGKKIPFLVDMYHQEGTKRSCNRIKEITRNATNEEKLHLYLSQLHEELTLTYVNHYNNRLQSYKNKEELINHFKYVILNNGKLVYNPELDKVGFFIGYAMGIKSRREKTYALRIQVAVINPENGEINKTNWSMHSLKFLDYKTTRKFYECLAF